MLFIEFFCGGMSSPAHMLVPNHSVASEAEVRAILEQYKITAQNLPLINLEDPALKDLQVRPGDVIKIERSSPITEKTEYYYRIVVE